jgi:hypothetical protein
MNPRKPFAALLRCRRHCLTPGRFLLAVLVAEACLLLSERFRWFSFNEHKGWTVLIAVAALATALSLMLVWFALSLVFRQKFQFSLRSLLLLVVVFAVPCSWLATEMEQARKQRAAVEASRGLGWTVAYDYENYERLSTSFFEPASDLLAWPFPEDFQPPGPAWLCQILGEDFFTEPAYVGIFTGAYGTDLRHLTVLKGLKGLALWGKGITDPMLGHVEGMKNLRSLRLCSPDLTDASLRHLEGLEKIESLDLVIPVTDKGLRYIEELTNLRSLVLVHTEVTDAGLVRLKSLTKLRKLFLANRRITDKGVKKLQQMLPACIITTMDWDRIGVDFDFDVRPTTSSPDVTGSHEPPPP